jgi:rSAM/selenodomain-associated transferase 1
MSGVLIMARAPRPGEGKTRLRPLLGPAGCARLQATLLEHTADWATEAAEQVWVAFTPPDAGAEIAVRAPAGVRLFPQTGADLGARLAAASRRVSHAHAGALCVVGTDAPLLGPHHVQAAEGELRRGYDACVIPARDGGYAMIALARPTPGAFALPPEVWGGPRVLELTLRALRGSGCATSVLDPVADLDTIADALALRENPKCPAAVRAALSQEGVVA